MDNNLLQYTFPFETFDYNNQKNKDLQCGNAIIIGNLFVTAAHVVENASKITFCINGKNHSYFTNQFSIIENTINSKQLSGHDIAILKLDNIYSPFLLADETLTVETEALSISYKFNNTKHQNNASNISKYLSETNDSMYLFVKSTATIMEYEDNFVGCKMSIPLEEGRSGSPLIKGNKVYGILHGGGEEGHMCIYESSQSIIKLLKENNITILSELPK